MAGLLEQLLKPIANTIYRSELSRKSSSLTVYLNLRTISIFSDSLALKGNLNTRDPKTK